MHLLRARFSGGIIAEIAKPKVKSTKVIVVCDGMPTVPSKKHVLEYWAEQGYWVFHPRYRGSWESSGDFLQRSPEEDILRVIRDIPRGFLSIWDSKMYKIKPSECIVFGSSFGGAAALLLSASSEVSKVVALSPVVDWTAESNAEPLDWLYGVVKQSFGEGYRVTKKNWKKLENGFFFNPVAHTDHIVGDKVLIIHADDDEIVLSDPVRQFSRLVNATLVMKKEGGHFSASRFIEDEFVKIIKKFI